MRTMKDIFSDIGPKSARYYSENGLPLITSKRTAVSRRRGYEFCATVWNSLIGRDGIKLEIAVYTLSVIKDRRRHAQR